MFERDNFFCALLEEDDFEMFKEVFSACTAEKIEPEQNLTDIIQKTNGECLRGFFDDPDVDHFVLLKRERDGQLGIVGESRICYLNDRTEFEDFHVLKDFRRRDLSNLLYESMLKRVAEDMPKISEVSLHIYDWNTPSIKAAKRNGFSGKGVKKPKGEFIRYSRSLEDLRSVSNHFIPEI